MANFEIITNNPLAFEKYRDIACFFDTDVGGMFLHGRDRVHLGAKLINHPLSGSVKPNESPYKSLVLSNENGMVDFVSLKLIESAWDTLKKLPEKKLKLNGKIGRASCRERV